MQTKSKQFQKVVDTCAQLSARRTNVMLVGETGTGKELIARHLHHKKHHDASTFLHLKCQALPPELNGFANQPLKTVFLDRVDELNSAQQTRLLGWIESTPKTKRMQCISSSQVDAAGLRRSGFRLDLLFRLCAFTVDVPPLRKRQADVLPLARQFLFDQGCNKPMTQRLASLIIGHSWPGNIRELKNVMCNLILFSRGEELDVSPELTRALNTEQTAKGSLESIVDHVERSILLKQLEACGWNKTKTSLALGMNRTQLYRKLAAHGITC